MGNQVCIETLQTSGVKKQSHEKKETMCRYEKKERLP